MELLLRFFRFDLQMDVASARLFFGFAHLRSIYAYFYTRNRYRRLYIGARYMHARTFNKTRELYSIIARCVKKYIYNIVLTSVANKMIIQVKFSAIHAQCCFLFSVTILSIIYYVLPMYPFIIKLLRFSLQF